MGEPHRIFTFAAAELEHNGVVVAEKIIMPFPPERKSFFVEHSERILEHEINRLHIPEFLEFVFAHGPVSSFMYFRLTV